MNRFEFRIDFILLFQYDLVGQTERKGEHDPKKRATDIIAQLDVSGDRKLTKEEFIAGFVYKFLKSLIKVLRRDSF